MKYSELMVDWLAELGYTHCFFVAGGNSMHLLDGVRTRMTCVATVHEVAAGIAAEYYNESGASGRAFALVTAGPGVTNILTAMGGAFLESRELLVIGGQAKSTDLATGGIRQRGIQEIDGVALAAPVCVATARLERPIPRHEFEALVLAGSSGRPGPVFIEVCLDAQGAPVDRADLESAGRAPVVAPLPTAGVEPVLELLRSAERPVFLIGGGVTRAAAERALPHLREAGVPLMTTWNGADRIGADEPLYAGRPNTWGQRSANILLQQADAIVAFGTRLGLQQTGFNWQQFATLARVAQIEIDPAELAKGHPRVDFPLLGDAGEALCTLARAELGDYGEWVEFCRDVRERLPLNEEWANETAEGFLSPYAFTARIAALCTSEDTVIPCSSGGAFTVPMQVFDVKSGQLMITNKGLASMGYGLSGAIGAALAHPGRRTVLFEGDGGFIQNAQELGTVAVNACNVKVFVFANEGYASIRMTQRNYFGGAYLGCDTQTGLGFPEWAGFFTAYGIPVHEITRDFEDDPAFQELFAARGPAAFVVPIDPEQSYFPKISSRVTETGSMESNPLHLMTPDLPEEVAAHVLRFLVPAPAAVQVTGDAELEAEA